MKQQSIYLAAIIALCSGSALAEGDCGDKRHDFRAGMLKKFDKDGDGKLNEEEKRAARVGMRQHWEKKKAEMMKEFDTDGDGKLSDEEKKAFREEFGKRRKGDKAGKKGECHDRKRLGDKVRKHLLEKFDKDGDGELSDEEHKAAKASWENKAREMREKFAEMKKKFMAKYDTDGDGKLSDEENKAMRDSMKKEWEAKKAEKLKLYDADGDGKLDEDERKEAVEAEKRKMMEKYDADGDGELSAEEKKAAFNDMMENNPMRLLHMMKDHHGKRGHDCKPGRRDGRMQRERPQRDRPQRGL